MYSSSFFIVDTDPHPSLKNLLLRVSHNLHERIRAIHDTNKQWSRDIKAWEKRKKTTRKEQYTQEQTDFNNFQDPQVCVSCLQEG
jgi:Asp-tRNA(Asn)/Glu-tRNA(Gln) amidotransferase B subunit